MELNTLLRSVLTFAPDLSHNLTVTHWNTLEELRPVLINNELKIHCSGKYIPFESIPYKHKSEIEQKLKQLI